MAVFFKESYGIVSLRLAPIVIACRVYMLTEIAIFEPDICVVAPGTSDIAGCGRNILLRGKSAICGNEADLNVLGSGGCKDVSLLDADKLTILKIGRCTAEDEVNSALDYAVFKVDGASFTLGELLRPGKAAGNYLLFGQRRKKQSVLMTAENTVFKRYTVTVDIKGDGLAYVASTTCGVLKKAISEGDLISVDQHAVASEGAALRSVRHLFLRIIRCGEALILYYQIALADMYL